MNEVYTAIESQLKANVPRLKDVERFFGQLAMDAAGTGNSIRFPAIFYELVGIRAVTISRGVQHCDGVLRLRHCDQALLASQLRTPALEQASYLALQNFRGGPLLVGLDRINIYPDANYRGVEVIISEYAIKYSDYSLLNSTTALVAGSDLAAEVEVA